MEQQGLHSFQFLTVYKILQQQFQSIESERPNNEVCRFIRELRKNYQFLLDCAAHLILVQEGKVELQNIYRMERFQNIIHEHHYSHIPAHYLAIDKDIQQQQKKLLTVVAFPDRELLQNLNSFIEVPPFVLHRSLQLIQNGYTQRKYEKKLLIIQEWLCFQYDISIDDLLIGNKNEYNSIYRPWSKFNQFYHSVIYTDDFLTKTLQQFIDRSNFIHFFTLQQRKMEKKDAEMMLFRRRYQKQYLQTKYEIKFVKDKVEILNRIISGFVLVSIAQDIHLNVIERYQQGFHEQQLKQFRSYRDYHQTMKLIQLKCKDNICRLTNLTEAMNKWIQSEQNEIKVYSEVFGMM